MSRFIETILPARLGSGFRWLIASSWATNLGDGLMMAAGPLLVSSQTRNPALVAAAAVAYQLPWLVFGLIAGALADRLDRRLLVMVMDGARVVVLVGLCALMVTGQVNIWLVMAALFLIGTAEVFADTTTQTLMPMLVAKADLGIANARIQFGFLTANQLLGPALGAALFAAGMVFPFVVQTVCVALGVVLIARVATPKGAVRSDLETRVGQDIKAGIGWLLHHRAMRTLALVMVAFNITWAAPWSVLVLWAQERVGIGDAGFGLLTTAAALGGLLGTACYDWIERRIRLATLMRTVLLCEVVFHLAMARVTSPYAAFALMFGFGGCPPACRADRISGTGRIRLHDLRDGRDAGRLIPGRADRSPVGTDRAVVVRLRWFCGHSVAGVARVGVHRARRRHVSRSSGHEGESRVSRGRIPRSAVAKESETRCT